jgi:hypothetical protein
MSKRVKKERGRKKKEKKKKPRRVLNKGRKAGGRRFPRDERTSSSHT